MSEMNNWAFPGLFSDEMPNNKMMIKAYPAVELGVAPAYAWECNPKYCGFYKVCGGGLKKEKESEL